APNLQWLISTIAPNSSVTITYTADLAGSATLNDGEQVINPADVTEYWAQPLATRVGDLAAEWRVYGQGGAGGDVAADTVTMTVGFPNVTVVKSALDDATDARAGVDFTWRIVATNQLAEPTAPAFGVDLSDVLPAGWVYATGTATVVTPYGSASVEPVCTPSCATPGATLRWNDVVTGSLQPLNPGANVTVPFDATPQSSLLTVGTTGTFDHVNTAGVPDADDVTGATSNLDGDYTGPDDTESARIRRSDLSVTKTVTAGPYSFGSEVNWTITVANAGPDTATGVTVADILPASLVFVSTVSSTQGTYSSSTGIWTVGSVANGASQTLVIRTRLNVIGPITNRAEVQASNQWDLDSTPAAVTAVTNEDDDDTVTISASSTSLGDLVWYDIDGDGTADVGEPGIPGVRVRLESEGLDGTFGTTDDFLGPDGVPGGGDDIPVTEVLTNATGFYGFLDLPTGDYRVVIDTTTLPAGMANTFDDDGNEDSRSGIVTLTSSTGYLGADFGYTGTGSIGDTIWLDRDASGGATRQAGEPGIGGIDLTLMWGGFDGDLATTSDNVTHPVDTTDAGGQYLFDLLPSGPYRRTVDTADLLAGTTWSYDLDGIGTPAAITTSLTAGQDRADVDLSLAGTGSIGDRVWLDHDSDGVLDGSETGLGGIDVTVTWFGPNGVLGGGDDVVTTTTTDAGGLYLVDHLPAGAYRVTVDTADLPVGVGPTFDLDGTGTANTTALTLGSAQDRVDADFGYSGLASIGDRLWFDIDGDGADAPEPGDTPLAGVPLTITWSGPDTIVGTSDDVAITTATDATGSYLVGSLPNGPVRVAV
ncbi:MAG: SdrD B-like domain-containing protein, partial [Actinomycetes bacterium]